MANFNRVILIGRLTADPESRTFSNGGKVAKFRFAAAAGRKKNEQTGQWEDIPMYIDCEAYNRGETGTLADTVLKFCKKGSLICIEGRLHLDQWEKDGQKQSKHKIVVDQMQLLEPKNQGEVGSAGENGGMGRAPARSSGNGFAQRGTPTGSGRAGYSGGYDNDPEPDPEANSYSSGGRRGAPQMGGDDDIPF